MKFWKKLRCRDNRNYPEVRNYDVVLLVIIMTFCTIWGGGLSRRGRCGGGGVGGVKARGRSRWGRIKRGRVGGVEAKGAESEGENQRGPRGRCRGGGVGGGESA
jgi:hypothetical protein